MLRGLRRAVCGARCMGMRGSMVRSSCAVSAAGRMPHLGSRDRALGSGRHIYCRCTLCCIAWYCALLRTARCLAHRFMARPGSRKASRGSLQKLSSDVVCGVARRHAAPALDRQPVWDACGALLYVGRCVVISMICWACTRSIAWARRTIEWYLPWCTTDGACCTACGATAGPDRMLHATHAALDMLAVVAFRHGARGALRVAC